MSEGELFPNWAKELPEEYISVSEARIAEGIPLNNIRSVFSGFFRGATALFPDFRCAFLDWNEHGYGVAFY